MSKFTNVGMSKFTNVGMSKFTNVGGCETAAARYSVRSRSLMRSTEFSKARTSRLAQTAEIFSET